jgi:hypothetical protein
LDRYQARKGKLERLWMIWNLKNDNIHHFSLFLLVWASGLAIGDHAPLPQLPQPHAPLRH